MANTKKVTKRDMFEQIKANYNLTDEEMAFIDHELELLAKKNSNSADRKPTANQLENEKYKTAILEEMSLNVDKKYSITDIIKTIPACAELTNQKVTSIVGQMVKNGDVVRVEEKRKAYFKIA